MPQVQLPIFPAGSVEINRELACRVEGEQVVYFNGHLPVFAHAKNDLASFRLFSSQLKPRQSCCARQRGPGNRAPSVIVRWPTARPRWVTARHGRWSG